MKNTIKRIGIIAFLAVIGFSFIACGGEEEKIVEVPIAGLAEQNVEPQETLADALDWVKDNYEDFNNYIIDLKDYDGVSYIAPTTLNYPGVRAVTITLTNTGTDERTITLKKTGSGGTSYSYSDTGSLFTIKTGVYLVIDGKLNLKGIDATADGSDNNATLIDIATGAGLVMKGQSKISGNTHNSIYGGGVSVGSYGVFIMEGGAITGNKTTASYGYAGGVYVAGNGTFTMTGGSISGNTATSDNTVAGGVYIGMSGTFTMTGGSISDNTATGGTVISGIYVSDDYSIFKLSGSPLITDTVGLYSYSSYSTAVITLNGAFTPTAPVPVDLLCNDATAYNSGSPTVWDDKAVLKWDAEYTSHPDTFPVDKFTLGKWLERNTSNSSPITGKHIDSTSGQLVND